MTFLTGLHGAIATVLICVLLFIDEAGVPLPFMPNEVLLIIAGLLIASGGVNAFVFYPLACLSLLGGSFFGYTWARRVGPRRLRRLAVKLRAAKAYDRATARVASATRAQIGITRVLPGVRVYATLVTGAAGVPLRTFMEANVPAILAWVALLTTAGYVVGAPAEHLLSAVETQLFNVALSGGLLIVLGVVGYRAARRAPDNRRAPGMGPFQGIRNRDRYWLACVVDAGIIAAIVAGLDRVLRGVLDFRFHILPQGQYDAGFIVLCIALAYIVVSRRSATGETAGERLFDISYVHHHRPELAEYFDEDDDEPMPG